MATKKQLVAQVRQLEAWGRQTRPVRAAARFSAARGGVLTGGIAYATLFSLFAGLTLGFTVLVAVLGNDEELRDEVVEAVTDVLPGLVDTGDGGAVPLAALQLSPTFTVAGIVAALALVMSAVSAVAALQTGLRAMFDLRVTENVVVGKARQLGGLVVAGAAVVVSAVLTSAAVGWLGAVARGLVGQVTGAAVALLVDTLTFVFAVRVLAGARPPRRDLLRGAVIAGVGLGVLRLLGTSVVSGAATANPLLASFAAVVVLLAWVNLVARVLLLAAAWTADPPAVDEHPDAGTD